MPVCSHTLVDPCSTDCLLGPDESEDQDSQTPLFPSTADQYASSINHGSTTAGSDGISIPPNDQGKEIRSSDGAVRRRA